MSEIKYGCQLYTWQMSYDKYRGALPHIFEIISFAGYTGVEMETCMLGDYFNDSSKLAALLVKYKLELASLCLVCDWRNGVETDDEKLLADKTIEYISKFPGAVMNLCQMPGADRENLYKRQLNAIACIKAVAERAADKGIVCTFHPNSPPSSLFRVDSDYATLLTALSDTDIGFCPDSGHIRNGDMNVPQMFSDNLEKINHVHFKDRDSNGSWALMGEGDIDFSEIIAILRIYGYNKWIMVEDESVLGEKNPDSAVIRNGDYLERRIR